MSWPVRSTRVAYENPWIVVREDEVVRPDGSEGVYGVVELRRPAVFVVAVTDADEVVLVTVDRHTVGPSVEVPAGGTDGEDPIVAARRELAEETGLEAGTWRQVGTMMALNGICRAPEVVYLATDLRPITRPSDADTNTGGDDDTDAERDHQGEEGISAVAMVALPDVLDMVRRGEITDGETVAALMYALLALGRAG